MSARYKLTVVGCAATWLMVGLHLPALHEVIDHGRAPNGMVLSMLALLVVLGVGCLWSLLRPTRS